MPIPDKHHKQIREMDVDSYATVFDYTFWKSSFTKIKSAFLQEACEVIQSQLGENVKRKDMVSFYQDRHVPVATKFIAAMMWGYEAPEGGRRAGYGAHRLGQMFEDPPTAREVLDRVALDDEDDVRSSYILLDDKLKKCGPNFFTKHFYFLDKSRNPDSFRLLIFDDRVATGLVRIFNPDADCLDLVRIAALRKADAYIRFIEYIGDQAQSIRCKPDQLEYYLFHFGS
jgi:hypothetical protein